MLLVLLVFFIMVVFAFSFPAVQTRAAKWLTGNLNERYDVDIKIDNIAITYKGLVEIGPSRALDHKKDTVLAFTNLKTSILNLSGIYNGDLGFGDLKIDGLYFNMVRYKGDKTDNLMMFIDKFSSKDKTPSESPFKLNTGVLNITNARVHVVDEESNLPVLFKALNMNLVAQSLSILGSDVHAAVTSGDFVMFTSAMRYAGAQDGLQVKQLQTDFTYTKTQLHAADLEIVTAGSVLKGDLLLKYPKTGFADFNNKVIWDLSIEESSVATNEIGFFYNELVPNEQIVLQGEMTGTLNAFRLKNLKAFTLNDIAIEGDMHLKNVLDNPDSFFIEGTFKNIQASSKDLESFLPNILGGIFPSEIVALGTVGASGYASINRNTLVTKLKGSSRKAQFETDLVLGQIRSGNPTYDGRIALVNLDVGKLAGLNELGNASLDVIVHGRGFNLDQLNTTVQGGVQSLNYNGYTYTNMKVDGTFKKPLFDGELLVNDPNLSMQFKGLVDLSELENVYKFDANIGYADLNKINIFKRDSVAVLKGRVVMDMRGSTLDNVKGTIDFFDTSYRNQNKDYFFEDFKIESFFVDDERFITVNSPDIIEGEISGKFILQEIPELFKNSIGNVYTNYRSKTITKDQYISYEFQIYEKIVELFFPDIALGENTILKGAVASNESLFKLIFRTPEINAYDILFNNVNVQVDNQNPIFNTFIKIDNIKNGFYDIDEFKLINVTRKDTLLFRTEFVSHDRKEDAYNLSFYHTVDSNNSSVVGIRNSDITFQGNKWLLNNLDKDVQFKFNHDFNQFSLDTLAITHNEERVQLAGTIFGNDDKDIAVNFKDVQIKSLLQPMDSLNLNGVINGSLDLKQVAGKYEPSSALTIKELGINETQLGDFDLNVTGNENLTRFTIDAKLAEENRRNTLTIDGFLDTSSAETYMRLNANLKDFNLVAFNPFGGIVVDKIRGLTTGLIEVSGPLKKPVVDGSLQLQNAGLRIPYLNTDFDIENNAVVDITSKSIDFNDLKLTDTKFKTSGILGGVIRHENFGFWNLDLSISSNRLLVLDTDLTPESLYYGTVFIDGDATIKGPTDKLVIAVTAASQDGTIFKIPINDGESVADTSAIYFLSPEEKQAKISGKVLEPKSIGGLELVFDLKVTPNAEVEITVDPANGSNLNGRGFGNLKLEINTNGKFVMNGDFIVTEGVYNFKYLGLVNKEFIIEPGGTIDWNGDPVKANIDISAVYKTNANPSVLLDNPNLNAQIPVEVVTTLNGDLTFFDPQFQIRFPNAASVVTSELQYRLEDKAQRQLQALSLVTVGSFYNPNSIGQNAVSGNLVESVTGIVNDLVQSDGSTLKFGVNYEATERNPNSDIQRSDRFGITLSTQITDRILINGRLGVPVGTTSASERAIIGNVEVEFLINDDGTLRLKLFNRENSLQQIGQQENYTQGIGLQYAIDFDTLKQLYEKIFHKNLQRDTTYKRSDNSINEISF